VIVASYIKMIAIIEAKEHKENSIKQSERKEIRWPVFNCVF